MSPISVDTVLGVVPLREFPDPCPARSPLAYPRWDVSSADMPRSRTVLIISGRNPPAPVRATPRSSAAASNWSTSSSSKSSCRSARASARSSRPATCSRSSPPVLCFSSVMFIVLLLLLGDPPAYTDHLTPPRCAASAWTCWKGSPHRPGPRWDVPGSPAWPTCWPGAGTPCRGRPGSLDRVDGLNSNLNHNRNSLNHNQSKKFSNYRSHKNLNQRHLSKFQNLNQKCPPCPTHLLHETDTHLWV